MRHKPQAALAVIAASLAATPAAAARPATARPVARARAAGAAAAQERTVTRLIDRIRVSNGLPALRANRRLAHAARGHSRDMRTRDYLSHDGPDGTPAGRIRAAGYRSVAVGETIAWGTGTLSTPGALVRGWMNSPLHRAIILSPEFREIGVGLARASGQAWATADFGTRR